MAIFQVFEPIDEASIDIVVSGTASTPQTMQGGEGAVTVYNGHSSFVRVRLGTTTAALATQDSFKIPPDRQVLIRRPSGWDYISVICETGTGVVTVHPGQGF